MPRPETCMCCSPNRGFACECSKRELLDCAARQKLWDTGRAEGEWAVEAARQQARAEAYREIARKAREPRTLVPNPFLTAQEQVDCAFDSFAWDLESLAGTAPQRSAQQPECTNHSPPWFTAPWRDWHRGHGCNKDDGKPRGEWASREIAEHARGERR